MRLANRLDADGMSTFLDRVGAVKGDAGAPGCEVLPLFHPLAQPAGQLQREQSCQHHRQD